MKILHILDHSLPLHSGYTFRTRAILEGQRALGWETAHVTSSKQIGIQSPVEDFDGLRFYRTSAASGMMANLPVVNQWGVVRGLEQRLPEVIAAERPDILHAHSPSLNGIAAIRVGRRLGIPVVYECRAFWEDAAADHGTSAEWGLRYRLSRRLETWTFFQANAVTCICEGLRADIVSRGIPESKVTVIPNGVDVSRFDIASERDLRLAAELGLAEATVFGFLGSFYAYEGLDLAVRALPRIREKYPQAHLLLVGGGPEEAELRHLIEQLGLAEHVTLAGRVPHDQVHRYYSLVDVLLYPRQPMRLTELVTPLKPLEAMAQGKLVLASDVGGHRELIRDGDNARLFTAGNVDALADAAISTLDGQDHWDALRRGGRAFVERERDWPVIIDRYRNIYANLV